MIHLDTSVLIDCLTATRRSEPRLTKFVEDNERIHISALVLFEWQRGHRTAQEIEDQEAIFPADQVVPFGPLEALTAADLYRKVKRPRGREIDLAIAACALTQRAKLWTLNPNDFKDIPGLKVL